jgi:hypothetical protein
MFPANLCGSSVSPYTYTYLSLPLVSGILAFIKYLKFNQSYCKIICGRVTTIFCFCFLFAWFNNSDCYGDRIRMR